MAAGSGDQAETGTLRSAKAAGKNRWASCRKRACGLGPTRACGESSSGKAGLAAVSKALQVCLEVDGL